MRRGVVIAAVAAVAIVLADSPGGGGVDTVDRDVELTGSAPPGRVNLIRNATSDFDPFLLDATPKETAVIDARFWRLRGYDPFFADQGGLEKFSPPVHLYEDLYAIYRDLPAYRRVRREHPEWVLRDADGNELFIPADCDGETCTQFAGDPGNPGFRRWWIDEAKAGVERGYAGLFVDDVNLDITTSDGAGELVRPLDPRTGEPMTRDAWRGYMADFAEEISDAFPDSEIVHNAQWQAGHADPAVRRQLAATDLIELERGFSDPGLVAGDGPGGFERFLDHIDALHAMGKPVVYEPYGLGLAGEELELAGYLLMREGEDAIATDFRVDPDSGPPGWRVDLGRPLDRRYRWRGVWRRDFTGGHVLVNPPGRRRAGMAPRSGRVLTSPGALPAPEAFYGIDRLLERLLP